MSESLRGKNAIVTGASMGIGRAVALYLAQCGVNVVVNSSANGPDGPGTQPGALLDLVAEISTAGGNAVYHSGSVTDYACAEQLAALCDDTFGAVDVLINCAGVRESGGSSILDMDPRDWQHVLGVHLSGTFNTCRAVAQGMKDRGKGSIINTASRAWLGCYSGTAYPAGKGGTISLSWAIANELRDHNVRCNVVCPGAKTRLSSGDEYVALINNLCDRALLAPELREAALNPAAPEYVAPLYAYLASDVSQGISGEVFSASGGYIGVTRIPEEEMLIYKDHASKGKLTLQDIDTALRP